MLENANPSSNSSAPQGPISEELLDTWFQELGQYTKSVSFKCPGGLFLRKPRESPDVRINFNVQVLELYQDAYEVELSFEAEAKRKERVQYTMALVYAGVFVLKGFSQGLLEEMLFFNCPATLFPCLRRLVADLSREGGFPPLLLDPSDFEERYLCSAEIEQARIVWQKESVAALDEARPEA